MCCTGGELSNAEFGRSNVVLEFGLSAVLPPWRGVVAFSILKVNFDSCAPNKAIACMYLALTSAYC
jgi:hypothetical protein